MIESDLVIAASTMADVTNFNDFLSATENQAQKIFELIDDRAFDKVNGDRIAGTSKIELRDAGIHVSSIDDGNMDLTADGAVHIHSPMLDQSETIARTVGAAAQIRSKVTFTGTLTGNLESFGILSQPTFSGNENGNDATMYAFYGEAKASVACTALYGARLVVGAPGGTTDVVYGAHVELTTNPFGTLTLGYGYYVAASTASTSWAFYNAAAGSNSFVGPGTEQLLFRDADLRMLSPADAVLEISADGYVRIGAGTMSHGGAAAGDFLVSGILEVDGAAWFDDSITLHSGSGETKSIVFTNDVTNGLGFVVDYTNDQSLLFAGAEVGRQIVLTSTLDQDHDHAPQTNPTLYVQSATPPDTNNTQYVSITHDQTNAVYTVGTGTHSFMGGKVGIGTGAVPQGGVGAAMLAIHGPDNSNDGPHIQLTTDADDYPLMMLLAKQHDAQITIYFDAYWIGGASQSSDVGSNFAISKQNDQLGFYAETGIAPGSPTSFIQAFQILPEAETMFSPTDVRKTYWRDLAIWIASLNDSYLDVAADGGVRFTTPTTYVSGNLGIGMTPDTKLSVLGPYNANSATVSLRSTDNDSCGLSLWPRSAGAAGASRSWQMATNKYVAGSLDFVVSTTSGGNPGTHVASFTSAGNVGIGSSTAPHGGVGYARLAIEGTDSNAAGPHVQWTTSTDNYPLMQFLMWTHDNLALYFDCYFDGATKSSDAGSNFAIFKASDTLQFKAESGIAQGGGVSLVTAFQIEPDAEIMISPVASRWTYVRDSDIGFSSQADSFFDIKADGAVRLTSPITYVSGDLGIGVDSPAARLHTHETTGLGGTAGDSQIISRESCPSSNVLQHNVWLYRDANGANWQTARLHDALSVDALYLTPGTDTRVWWERDAHGNIQSWGTSADTYMTIAGGDVGIGTVSPDAKLQVVGTAWFGEDGTNYTEHEADGSVVFHGTAGLPFGEIYVRGNAAATAIAVATTYVQFLGFGVDGESKNATPDHTNDHITIDKAGKYLVTLSLHCESVAGPAQVFAFEVRKNNGGTIFNNLHAHRQMTGGGGDIGSVTLSGIIDLAATDTVELWTTNDTTDDNVLIEDCTMTVVQVAGT